MDPMVFMTTDMDGSTTTATSILPPLPSATPVSAKSAPPGKVTKATKANETSKTTHTGAKAPVVAVAAKEEKKQKSTPPSSKDEKKEKATSPPVVRAVQRVVPSNDAINQFGPVTTIYNASRDTNIETVCASNVIAKSFVDMAIANRTKIARRITVSWSLHGREIYIGGPTMFMAACVHAAAKESALCVVCSQPACRQQVPLIMHPSELVDATAYRTIVDFLENAKLSPVHSVSYAKFIEDLFTIYKISGPTDSRPELVAHRIKRAIGLDDKGVPCLVGHAPMAATSSRIQYQVFRLCTEWQITKLIYTLHVLECCSTSRPTTLATLKKKNKNKDVATPTINHQYARGANVYVKEVVPKDAHGRETIKAKAVIAGPLFAYAGSTHARSQTTERPSVDNMITALKAFEDLHLIGLEGTEGQGQSAYSFESTPASFGVFNKVGNRNEWNGKTYRLISVYAVLSNKLLEDNKDVEPFSFANEDDVHASMPAVAPVGVATAAAAAATTTAIAVVRDANGTERSPKRLRTSVITTAPLTRTPAVTPSSPTIDLTDSQTPDEDMPSTSSSSSTLSTRGPHVLPVAAFVPTVIPNAPADDELVVDE
jgi:hypothetical protein